MKTAATSTLPPLNEVLIGLQDDGPLLYTGTAAQLEAEGLIPPGFCWPKDTRRHMWQAGVFDFYLRRLRPAGHRGPWVQLDYWRLCVYLQSHERQRRDAQRQFRQYAAATWFASPAGRMQRTAFLEHVMRARADAAFQRFRACIPALAALDRPARRTRRTEPAGGAA